MSYIKLYSKFHIPIELGNDIPPDPEFGKIPKANRFFAEDKGNQFIFQELKGNGFTFRISQFNIAQPTSFTITSDYRIYFQISMYETTEYELAGYGSITLHQRGYNLITVPSFSAQFRTSERSLFIPIEIALTNEYLKPLTSAYPQVEEFLSNAEKGKPAVLFNVNQIASTEMMALIDLIIDYGMHRDSDPDWLNVYVAELLHHALRVKPKGKKIRATKEEVACIYEAEQLLDDIETKTKNSSGMEMKLQNSFIDMDIDSRKSRDYQLQQNPQLMSEVKDMQQKLKDELSKVSRLENQFQNTEETKMLLKERKELIKYHLSKLDLDKQWSVGELAEYANMSTYTFNKTFREIFGQSVTNYIKETMWQSVLQTLLLGTENMKTISSLAGYNDPASFSRAFKKRFGHTPSEYVQDLTKKLTNYKKTANRNMG
jgi:AraC-like DNA-binding protein